MSYIFQHEHADAVVKMEIIRNRHKTLSYRIVRVMLAQWIVSRYSRQIDTDEDVIEAKADTLLAQMNRHNQVKVRKNYDLILYKTINFSFMSTNSTRFWNQNRINFKNQCGKCLI